MGYDTPKESEMVEISKERLEDLERRAMKLSALEAAGVDNWSGYDYAMELLSEWEDEN